MGIGRNEYLALVNDFKNTKSKRFQYQNISTLLDHFPNEIHIDYWWTVHIGHVLDKDIHVSAI